MRRAFTLLLGLLGFSWCLSCGTRTGLEDEKFEPVVCDTSQISTTGPTVDRSCGTTCTLSSHDPQGHPLRLECDGQSCQLFVNEALVCECIDLDYTTTCSHGIPTCLARGIFSFNDISFASCP